MVLCNNVQCNKKCELLVQCDKKMVQCYKIVVNDVVIVAKLFEVTCLL